MVLIRSLPMLIIGNANDMNAINMAEIYQKLYASKAFQLQSKIKYKSDLR